MQAYPAYGQNKGTLMPGQAISVGKYNVQVERYLSQGQRFLSVYPQLEGLIVHRWLRPRVSG
jgi:hypothetical protein